MESWFAVGPFVLECGYLAVTNTARAKKDGNNTVPGARQGGREEGSSEAYTYKYFLLLS